MRKRVVVKIPELLKKHGISLRYLSRLADILHAALNEQNINFAPIEKIAEVFGIQDIREIVELDRNNISSVI
ncbi:XRE family transcriptional regulator [Cohnella xylanilytica]|uniref:XRE family transcriptional regulator n=1 Tax=Cohnella xylanilytica TaxID=557555 RepID=A0A841TVW8_9BACL|nr:XRE family transcriptional regulator [Cohnella xylanilytica]MBB6690020.1 XRE family transcriptional regulator [Cohnella xylanilytica]